MKINQTCFSHEKVTQLPLFSYGDAFHRLLLLEHRMLMAGRHLMIVLSFFYVSALLLTSLLVNFVNYWISTRISTAVTSILQAHAPIR